MDKEMIERCAAKLISDIENFRATHQVGDVFTAKDAVVSVIKAMREPTEKMLEEGAWVPTCGEIVGHSVAKQCWGEMLDAITGEGA